VVKWHYIYNMAKTILIFLFVCIIYSACAQKEKFIQLRAFKYWKDNHLCGDELNTDTLGNIWFTQGCENRVHMEMGRYTYKNDTLLIDTFHHGFENLFVTIKKTPRKGKMQTVKFETSNGYPIVAHYDSTHVFRLTGYKDTDWFYFESSLKLERGKYKAIQLWIVNKLFNTEKSFWLEDKFDYTLTLNLSSNIFESKIESLDNMKTKYLLVRDDYIFFPENENKLAIQEFNGKSTYKYNKQ